MSSQLWVSFILWILTQKHSFSVGPQQIRHNSYNLLTCHFSHPDIQLLG